jgi:glycosyltransferase involved in cell wall biosynthesis
MINHEIIIDINKHLLTDLSIIIPTFNRPIELVRAIKSLINVENSNHRIEVVVIDNASYLECKYEEIEDIVKAFDINFKYYKNTYTMTWSANFNKGVRLSNSDYFLFLFDDDELTIDFHKLLLSREFKGSQALFFFHEIVYTSNILTLRRRIRILVEKSLKYISLGRKQLTAISFLLTVPSFIGSIYNKNAFLKTGGFDGASGPTADYLHSIDYWEKHGIIRLNYHIIRYYHGNNASSMTEINSQFATANLNYRLELINKLKLSVLAKRLLRYLIYQIYYFESYNRNILNTSIYAVIFIMGRLNLI